MKRYDPEEDALWEKVKPYLIGCDLPDDVPEDIKKADEKLRKMLWDPDRGQ